MTLEKSTHYFQNFNRFISFLPVSGVTSSYASSNLKNHSWKNMCPHFSSFHRIYKYKMEYFCSLFLSRSSLWPGKYIVLTVFLFIKVNPPWEFFIIFIFCEDWIRESVECQSGWLRFRLLVCYKLSQYSLAIDSN